MSLTDAKPKSAVRFGVFEFDLGSGRLRKHGIRIRLQHQPMRILALLLERPGEVVSREKIQSELWPGDTFVEFEQSLNAAVKRLRAALGDSADNPRFVETIPKQGYRFIAPTQTVEEPAPIRQQRVRETVVPTTDVPGTRRWYWVAGVAATVLTAVATWYFAREQSAAAPVATNASARIYSIETGHAPVSPSISPDGQYVAYFSIEESDLRVSLYIRDLSETRSRRVGVYPIPYLHQPAWSADSKYVAAILKPGTLFKVSVSGGEPAPVIQLPERLFWRAEPLWAPFEHIFLGGQEVREDLGKLFPAIQPMDGGPGVPCGDASFVPGLNLYLCGGAAPSSPILLMDAKGSVLRSYEIGSNPVYSPSGHLIFSSGESLWALPVSGETLEPSGAPVRIARDALDASLTKDGSLVFLESTGLRQQLVWKDRSGRELGTVGPPQWRITQPTLHRDSGRILSRARMEPSDEWTIWLFDPGQGISTPEMASADTLDRPYWVPGGDEFTYTAQGEALVRRIQSPASKPEVVIGRGDGISWIRDWCPDGNCAVFTRAASGSVDIWIMDDPFKESRSLRPYLASPQDETSAAISPDGRYIAYQARRPDQFGVYVNTFPVATREIPIAAVSGQPVWRADGKEIFFVEEGRFLTAVPVQTSPEFEVTGPPVRLFEHKEMGSSRSHEYDVSADGQRFIVVKTLQEPKNVIRVVQNWVALLQ